ADVDDGHVILDARNGALHHLAFEGFVLAAEAFVEEGREIVAGRECRGRHECLVSCVFKLACRVPRHRGGASPADLVSCTAARAPCAGGVRWMLACGAQTKRRVRVPVLAGTPTRSRVKRA